MKALSLQQPYAWLILQRANEDDPVVPLKPVESSTWPLPKNFTLPQRIYVHASLTMYDVSLNEIHDRMTEPQWLRYRLVLGFIYTTRRGDRRGSWDFGYILGEITITGCKFRFPDENDDLYSPWHFPGQYGYSLACPVLYREPVPCKGMPGFFTLPPDVEEKCRAQREKLG